MGEPAFGDFAEPVGRLHLVAGSRDGLETPFLFTVQGIGVFASFEEDVAHGGEVVLETVVNTAQHARAEGYLQHPSEEFHFRASGQSAGAFEHLHGGPVAGDLDHLGQKPGAVEVDAAEFVLRHGTVHLDRYQVGDYSCYFACSCHY